jgi:hypothetical protein
MTYTDEPLFSAATLQPPVNHCNSGDTWCLFDVAQLVQTDLTTVTAAVAAAVVNRSNYGPSAAASAAQSSGLSPSSVYDLLMTSTLDDGNFTEIDFDFQAQLRQLLAQRRPANSPPVADGFKTAVDGMNLYVTPIIIAVGVAGNALSLAVFSLTHLRRLSSSFYLSTLSVADIVFLAALVIVWLQRVDVNLFNSDGWCQSVLYATRVSEFLAAWYVVSFTAERYVTVYYPLRKDSFCTRRRARLVVFVLTIVAFVFYLPTFWTHDVVLIGHLAACSPLPRHHYVITALTSVDLLVSCLVPSIAVVALNVRIIAKIHRYQKVTLGAARLASNFTAAGGGVAAAVVPDAAECSAPFRRRSMVQTSVSASGSMHIKFTTSKMVTAPALGHYLQPTVLPVNQTNPSKRLSSVSQQLKPEQILMTSPLRVDRATVERGGGRPSVVARSQSGVPPPAVNRRLVRGQSQLRTARMLLVLSSVIVLLNLPTHVFRVQSVVHQLIGGLARAHRDRFTWQELFQLVQFTNFAVNFFVYSLCGRQFRIGLVRLCTRQRIRMRRCAEQMAHGPCFCCLRCCCCCCCCCRRSPASGQRRRRRRYRQARRSAKACSRQEQMPVEMLDAVAGRKTASDGSLNLCFGRRPNKQHTQE